MTCSGMAVFCDHEQVLRLPALHGNVVAGKNKGVQKKHTRKDAPEKMQ
jgi:hypothetical protein